MQTNIDNLKIKVTKGYRILEKMEYFQHFIITTLSKMRKTLKSCYPIVFYLKAIRHLHW